MNSMSTSGRLSETKPDSQTSATRRGVQPGVIPSPDGPLAALERLQRLVGNRAVNGLIQRYTLAQRATGADYTGRSSEEEPGAGTPEVGLAGGPVSDGMAQRIDSARGSGTSLDSGTQSRMESAFGQSFGGVRVHADGEADALNHSLSAVAFTTGQDIFFRQGTYQPGSSSGNQLLAHELTHVVQQRGMSGGGPLTVGPAGDRYEQEADAMGGSIARVAENTGGAATIDLDATDDDKRT
jgi:hypothetical protein